MLRIAICDDNQEELEGTYQMVTEYIKQNPEKDASIYCFNSAYDLVEYIESSEEFSIYLLDIIMPVMDGISIGELIRERDHGSIIIYLTTSPDYAVSSYSVQAYYYILKPFKKEELYPVLEGAMHKLEKEISKSQLVKTAGGVQAVRFHTILYAECRAHSILYHLSEGRTVRSVTLREPFDLIVGPLLRDHRFMKISASYLINMNYVESINGNKFLMTDGTCLPCSRSMISSCKKRYINFLLEAGKE